MCALHILSQCQAVYFGHIESRRAPFTLCQSRDKRKTALLSLLYLPTNRRSCASCLCFEGRLSPCFDHKSTGLLCLGRVPALKQSRSGAEEIGECSPLALSKTCECSGGIVLPNLSCLQPACKRHCGNFMKSCVDLHSSLASKNFLWWGGCQQPKFLLRVGISSQPTA